MYLEHFGLDQAPFRITPDTGIFFAGARRGATLEALTFTILNDEGIVKVSGEVGAGKTMLCRMLLAQLPDLVDTVYLSNPTLGPEDLLRLIANDLEVPVIADNPGTLLLNIQQTLIERFARGRRVVMLVDEAHAMPAGSLEQIRLLSNLETSNQKLLQIVLFGQPELDAILARKSMRQLKDRITHNFRIDPLGGEEVGEYLDFRLRAAGYRGPTPFARSSVRLLGKASDGLSRRLNILADKALLSAYTRGANQVKPKHVQDAILDCDYPLPGRNAARIAMLLGIAVVLLAATVYRDQLVALAPQVAQQISRLSNPAPPTEAAGPGLTAANGPATTPSTGAAASTAQTGEKPAAGDAQRSTRIEAQAVDDRRAKSAPETPAAAAANRAVAGVSASAKTAIVQAAAEPTPALPPAAEPPRPLVEPAVSPITAPVREASGPTKPVPPAEAVAADGAHAETTADRVTESGQAAPKKVPATPLPIALGPLAAPLQANTPQWVRSRPEQTWFIQLHTVDGGRVEDIERYIERVSAQLDPSQLRIYVRDLGWAARVGIIYGEYSSRSEVQAALRRLPSRLRAEAPYPRPIRGLR